MILLKYGLPVAQYFDPPSHCSLNDFAVTGIIHCNYSNVNGLTLKTALFVNLEPYLPLGLRKFFMHFSMRKF